MSWALNAACAETSTPRRIGDAGVFDLQAAVKTMLISRLRPIREFVLLIGGPGCAGKSTFASELARDFVDAGLQAAVLDLDCYLLERAEREKGTVPISGYNPTGYLLDNAARDIRSLISRRPVMVSPYDKPTSRRAPLVCVEPARVLIVEGSMALRDPIYAFGDASIFLDSTQAILFANRTRRELGYGATMEQIERKFLLLRQDYFIFIRPQRKRADLIAQIDGDYAFTRLALRSGAAVPAGLRALRPVSNP
jgi:uridine kinase